MEDLIYELEVDSDSLIVELPVNENNMIELDYTDLELEEEDVENLDELESTDMGLDDMEDDEMDDTQDDFDEDIDF